MYDPEPVTLEGHGVRLEPLGPEHGDGLSAAAADGKLWELWFTSVPGPGETADYRRRDGSVRDSVMYSILASEWPPVRRHLEWRLSRG